MQRTQHKQKLHSVRGIKGEAIQVRISQVVLICSLLQSWTRGCKQIDEIKQGFCMECLTAELLRIFSKGVKIWLLDVRLGTRYRVQAFQERS